MTSSVDWIIEQLDELIPYEGITASQIFADVIAKAQELHKAERIAQLEEIVSRLEEDGLYALPGIKHTLENLKK